jgi:hypothetical protein
LATRRAKPQLIIESHPKGYVGYPFVTLIQYQDQPLLTIVDNMDEDKIQAYVLDLCGPESVDEQEIIAIALDWYTNSRNQHPISIEFSKRGLISDTSRIFRILNVNFVTRFIGLASKYSVNEYQQVRRRKRKTH